MSTSSSTKLVKSRYCLSCQKGCCHHSPSFTPLFQSCLLLLSGLPDIESVLPGTCMPQVSLSSQRHSCPSICLLSSLTFLTSWSASYLFHISPCSRANWFCRFFSSSSRYLRCSSSQMVKRSTQPVRAFIFSSCALFHE